MSDRILYIGPYRKQFDGWGNSSKNWAECLSALPNIDFCPIYENNGILPPKLQDREVSPLGIGSGSKGRYGAIIHHMLPISFIKFPGVRNIGLIDVESTINDTPWVDKCNEMDIIVVDTDMEIQLLEDSGITTKIHALVQPYVLHPRTKERESNFAFYYIGSSIERKNLSGLLCAYIQAFGQMKDPPLLYIKTDENISSVIDEVTNKYRISFTNSNIKIETRNFSEEDMLAIHQRYHCYVNLSHGESVNIPLIEALAMDNLAIITDKTGMINDSDRVFNLRITSSMQSPCFSRNPPLPYLYKCSQCWKTPSIIEAAGHMANIYDDSSFENYGERVIEKHSHKNVLELFREKILSGI